ncbi:MAG: SPOR domain-containing protein, partial [Saprospiraceae bacterium]
AGQWGAGVHKIEIRLPGAGDYGVQVASLSSLDRVMTKVAELQGKWFDNILVKTEGTAALPVYKVVLGPFTTEKQAQEYEKSLKSKYKMNGFTVRLTNAVPKP